LEAYSDGAGGAQFINLAWSGSRVKYHAGSGHDVQVVGVVARGCTERVIALGNEDDVAVLDRPGSQDHARCLDP
jgi:hypothetical protein